MNTNKIVMGAIGVMVAVVMIGGAFLPAIDSAINGQQTVFKNELSNKYSVLYDEDIQNVTATIVLNDFSDGYITTTINGQSYQTAQQVRGIMIMCDKANVSLSIRDSSIGIATPDQNISDITLPITVTVSNGNVNIKDSAEIDITVTPTEWMFIPNPNGTYQVTYRGNGDAYINSIDDLYFSTWITTSAKGFVWGHGDQCTHASTGNTYNMDIDEIAIDNYLDVYKADLDTYAIDTALGSNSDNTPFVPYLIMIPNSVVGHTSTNEIVSSMFSIMPIVGIAGLVIAGVYVFISRK